MSLISTLLPILMRQENFSLTTIGLLQFIKLPWILKLLWAPLVDKYTSSLKSYKRWIWSSEIAYALCMASISTLNLSVNFSLILCLVIIAFICSATQDIATDALTSQIFSDDSVRANKLQSMGQFAGTIIGGGLLVAVYKYIGWTPLFLYLTALVILLAVPLFSYKDESKLKEAIEGSQVKFRDIWNFFRQKGAKQRSLMLILFNAGLVGTMAMMKPYLVDANYSLEEIGLLFTIYGASCGFLASWIGGTLLARIGRQLALRIASTFIFIASCIICLISYLGLLSLPWVMISLALLWGAYGVGTVMIYSQAMDFIRPGREGTDFTLQIVLLHLSSVVIAGLSGKLASMFGYSTFFVIEALLSLISLIYIYRYGSHQ